MAYPLNDSFENPPASGYYTTNATVVYNPIDQCLDVSGTSVINHVRFDQPSSGDFWFEADLVMVEDNVPNNNAPNAPWNYKSFGVQLMSHSSSLVEGIRFGFYKDQPFLGYYNTSNVEVSAMQYGQLLRTAELGRSYTLGLWIKENPNYGNVHHVQAYIDGVLQYEVYGSPNFFPSSNLWRPAVWRTNCRIKIHAIRGNLGSGLTGWPATVSARGPKLRPLFRFPQSDRWDDTGLGARYGNRFASLRPMVLPIYFHGKGSIIGTVKKAATPDNLPLSRRVYLIDEDSNIVVKEVWSDAAGNYRFDQVSELLHWTVIAYDHEKNFRSVIANNLKAVAS